MSKPETFIMRYTLKEKKLLFKAAKEKGLSASQLLRSYILSLKNKN